jgi:multidrug resistance efflux pump
VNRRTIVIGVVLCSLVVATGIGLYVRSASAVSPGVIAVAGNVRVETSVVRAPSIARPVPDITAGLTTIASAASAKRAASSSAPSMSRAPVVSGFLSEVLVAEGALVTTGQVLARLDTTMLDLGVAGAQAAARKATADLDVLDNNVSKLRDSRSKLVTARRQLTAARASLATTIAALVAQRDTLEAQIAVIQALIAQPGGPPPHIPPYPVLLVSLRSALSGLKTGLAGARAGLAKIDANLAKIRKGIAQMDSALRQVKGVRALAVVNATSRGIAVRLAESRRDSATLTSPASGLVTYARMAGAAVMVGAPIVRIRPDGPVRVDTYLTPGQLASVAVGTPVSVDFDSNAGAALPGRIAVIGDAAVVPPTSFPTAIVHMTRAVRVTIELDPGQTAPPGTPVDIEIRTGSARL